MTDFPDSSAEVKKLAIRLVGHLRRGIKNTSNRRCWSNQNFRMLEAFAKLNHASYYPNDDQSEFLWDFVAYISGRGVLLTVESEWSYKLEDLEHDFEKLFYVRSPLKLFMCRVTEAEKAEGVRSCLEKFMKSNCTEYSAGEVFIIYCVWWADENGENRDVAYTLQIDGKPSYQRIGTEHFQRVSD